MTDHQRIAEITARCEQATPGPWWPGEDETIETPTTYIAYRLNTLQDATFIAHSREDVPFLLYQLTERDKELKRLQKEVAALAIESIEREKTLARLEAEVMQLREAQRWISVTEGLPKERHYPPVICGHSEDDWTDAAVINDAGRFINSEGCEIYPTHWLPLPAPPEEGAGK